MSVNEKTIKQDSLPFPPTPSASIAGRTMQESVYKRRVEPRRLPADSPNILIVLIDDAGPGLPSTFGGEVQTLTMDPSGGLAADRVRCCCERWPGGVGHCEGIRNC
jgi:hypothetical protein